MDYTMLSIKLICTLKSDGVTTTECMKHTLTSLHVTLADVLRLETEVQPIDNSNGDFCKSPEAHMTNGLLCMYNSCPNHADDFSQFTPWSWFMSVVDDVITQCSLDPEACVSLIQHPYGDVLTNDLNMMMAITVASMVTAIVLLALVCVIYRRHRRNVVIKEGYQKLLNDGEDS